MGQIALPLENDTRKAGLNFLIGSCNAAAVDQLGDWKRWPFGTAILVGPPRSGKTLLGSHFERRHGAVFVDNAECAAQNELFHQWNEARAQMRPMLLASAHRPADWSITLPDLASRLASAQLIELRLPDDDLLIEILRHHAQARGLLISETILQYAAPRIERGYAAAEHLIAQLDQMALARKLAVTLAMTRDAIAAAGLQSGGGTDLEG